MKRPSTVFSSMTLIEKLLVFFLAAVFIFSIGTFIRDSLQFSISREANVFTEGIVGHASTLNPLYIDFNEVDRDISRLIFSGLVRYDPLQKNFISDLASSWERSPNGLAYTFTLRDTAQFHDDMPVTVDDVIFTFRDIIQDPQFTNPILKKTFEGIVIDSKAPNTVTFTLPKVSSYFISNLTVGIVPKHILENEPTRTLQTAQFGQQPIGSGPYKVTSARFNEDGDRVILEAFSNYYGTKPGLQTIRIFTFPDEEKLVKERAALHAVSKLNGASRAIQELSQDPRFAFYPYTLPQFGALYFNTVDTVIKEKTVRRALMRTLDKNALLEAGEKRMDTILGESLQDDPRFAHNLTHAAGALDTAGLLKDANGIRQTPAKQPYTLVLLTLAHDAYASMADKIAAQWQAVGIQTRVDKVEPEELYQRLVDGAYGALFIRQNLGYNPDVYPLFHSSQLALGDSGLNFSNFKSFRTDGLTEALRKETNPPDKEKLLRELSNVLAEEVPVIFIDTPVYTYALDKRLESVTIQDLRFHSDRFSIIPYLSL